MSSGEKMTFGTSTRSRQTALKIVVLCKRRAAAKDAVADQLLLYFECNSTPTINDPSSKVTHH